MNIKAILQECHEWKNRKTVMHRSFFPREPRKQRADVVSVTYATGMKNGKRILKTAPVSDFQNAGLSILPIGQHGFASEVWVDEKNEKTQGQGWYTRYGYKDWKRELWRKSYGLQVFTGTPSNHLTTLDFEYEFIRDHREPAEALITALCSLTETPLLTISKGGGLRLCFLTPGYVHSKATDTKEWIVQWDPETNHKTIYLEIFGDKGLDRWDARYQIVLGCLFDIPTVPAKAILDIISPIREQLHKPKPKPKPTPKAPAPKAKPRTEKESHPIGSLPSGIRWDASGKSQYFTSQHCKVTKHRSNRETVQFQKIRDGIRGHCFNCGESWYEITPTDTRTRPVKLEKRITDPVFEFLDRTREVIRKAYQSETRVNVIRSDTGTNKTSLAKAYLIDSNDTMLLTTPTTELATEITERFGTEQHGLQAVDVFQYRGLVDGYNKIDAESQQERLHAFNNGTLMCIYGIEADAYRRKGGNMYIVFCPTCAFKADCNERRYLSQREEAKHARVVVIPVAQAITSRRFNSFTKNYLKSYFNDTARVALIDDVNLFDLYSTETVSKKQLHALIDMWTDDTVIGQFAIDLLHALEVTRDLAGLRDVIEFVKERGKVEELREQLQSIRLDGKVTSLDKAVLDGKFNRDHPESMPSVDKEETLFDKMYAFFKHYTRNESMPIAYENDILTFYVPPLINPAIEKLFLASATVSPEAVRQVFGNDIAIYDAPPTAWDPDAKLFQLRTLKAPRRTAYEFEVSEKKEKDGTLGKTYKPIGLSKIGKELWQLAEAGIRSCPQKKHAVITYKKALEWLEYEIAELDIVTSHYGAVSGLDTKFDDCTVFWILFSPDIPPDVLKLKARILYGNDDTPLDFTRNEQSEFTDARVQTVYELCVLSELVQAIGRARLVSKANRVIVLCSHYLKHITDRAILFDTTDWQNAKEMLENLESVVSKREQAEAEAKGNVEKTMQLKGVQERQAYNLTKADRENEHEIKTERILELHLAGKSQRAIEKQLKSEGYKKCSRKAISQVIKDNNVDAVQNCNPHELRTPCELQFCTTPAGC